MSMTVVVTRNVTDRVRGFLASSMLELVPGVYSAPRISFAVRERVWRVLSDWFSSEMEASIVMVWANPDMPGGQSMLTLGCPPIKIAEIDGLLVTHKTSVL